MASLMKHRNGMTLIQIANMNERIKALLLNARNMFDNGVTESDNKIYIHGSEENLEKFAELIVWECMKICEDVMKKDNSALACWSAIKGTFRS
jgi:hypothetical protein